MRARCRYAFVVLFLSALTGAAGGLAPATLAQTPNMALSARPYDLPAARAELPASIASAPAVEPAAHSLSPASAADAGVTAAPAAVRVAPLTAAHLSAGNVLGRAYLDAFTILSADNSCSRFFGGALGATLVLNKLGDQLQTTLLDDPAVGIRMRGQVTTYRDMPTGVSYRLFDKAMINTQGPFYPNRRVNALTVGSFWQNSREARTLMLLHELAHLIKGADGSWLIPDDAGDAHLSQRNTATIEAACRAQIRAL